jgi:hypothetical protein
MWGLLAVGAALAIAGTMEINFLDSNMPMIVEKSTFLAEAQKSAARINDSASLALSLGIFNMIGALVLWPALARAIRLGRVLIIIFVIAVAVAHIFLIMQDGTIGVEPYQDMSHNLGEQDVINSLLVWPGYFFLLYPAEVAGLILAVMIGWRMLQEPTVEYFQQHRRVTTSRVWDVSEILAKRQDGVS